jgi:phospholipid/cholesterol/gamma-HCH transport system ATP-binding protein
MLLLPLCFTLLKFRRRVFLAEQPLIVVENLVKNLGDRRILDGVNLKIYKGKITVIMGGSGCGKSTLLRHLVGAIRPDSGKIYFQGKDMTRLSEREMNKIRLKFGMVFQNAALLDSLNVEDNISLPLREHTKLDRNIIKIIVKLKLGLVNLRGFEKLMPSELSGGMRKRVGLARAIALDPEVVFYDEPTAGLDPVVCGVIDKLILDLSNKLSITSVVVTHDMNSVFRIADQVAMLHKGRIIACGSKEEIKNTDNPVVRQFITGSPEGPIQFMDKGDDYLRELTM